MANDEEYESKNELDDEELDLEETDLDKQGEDDDEFDMDLEEIEGRKPQSPSKQFLSAAIKGVGKGTLKGITSAAKTMFPNITDAVGEVKETFDKVTTTRDEIKDQMLPELQKMKRSTKKIMPRAERYMPPKLQKKLQEATEGWEKAGVEEGEKQPSKEEEREASITAAVDAAMAKQAKLTEAISEEERSDRKFEQIRDAVQFEKQQKTLMSMDRSLLSIDSFNRKIHTEFLKKDLELQYKQLYTSKDVLQSLQYIAPILEQNLKQITHNTGIPEYLKRRGVEEKMREQWLKQWGQLGDVFAQTRENIMEGVKQKITGGVKQAGEMAEMLADAAEMQEDMQGMEEEDMTEEQIQRKRKAEAIEASTGMMGRALGGLMGPAALKRFGKTTGKVDEFAQNWRERLGLWMQELKEKGRSKGGIFELATSPIAEVDPGLKLTQPSFGAEQERADFDEATKRSIVEIIPGYLSKQLKTLQDLTYGGDHEELVFNVKRQAFTTAGKMKEDVFLEAFGKEEDRQKGALEAAGVGRAQLQEIEGGDGEQVQSFDQYQDEIARIFTNHASYIKPVMPMQIISYLNGFSKGFNANYISQITEGIDPEIRDTVLQLFVSSLKNPDGSINHDVRRAMNERLLGQMNQTQHKKIFKNLFEGYGQRRYFGDIITSEGELNIEQMAEQLSRRQDEIGEKEAEKRQKTVQGSGERFAKEQKDVEEEQAKIRQWFEDKIGRESVIGKAAFGAAEKAGEGWQKFQDITEAATTSTVGTGKKKSKDDDEEKPLMRVFKDWVSDTAEKVLPPSEVKAIKKEMGEADENIEKQEALEEKLSAAYKYRHRETLGELTKEEMGEEPEGTSPVIERMMGKGFEQPKPSSEVEAYKGGIQIAGGEKTVEEYNKFWKPFWTETVDKAKEYWQNITDVVKQIRDCVCKPPPSPPPQGGPGPGGGPPPPMQFPGPGGGPGPFERIEVLPSQSGLKATGTEGKTSYQQQMKTGMQQGFQMVGEKAEAAKAFGKGKVASLKQPGGFQAEVEQAKETGSKWYNTISENVQQQYGKAKDKVKEIEEKRPEESKRVRSTISSLWQGAQKLGGQAKETSETYGKKGKEAAINQVEKLQVEILKRAESCEDESTKQKLFSSYTYLDDLKSGRIQGNMLKVLKDVRKQITDILKDEEKRSEAKGKLSTAVSNIQKTAGKGYKYAKDKAQEEWDKDRDVKGTAKGITNKLRNKAVKQIEKLQQKLINAIDQLDEDDPVRDSCYDLYGKLESLKSGEMSTDIFTHLGEVKKRIGELIKSQKKEYGTKAEQLAEYVSNLKPGKEKAIRKGKEWYASAGETASDLKGKAGKVYHSAKDTLTQKHDTGEVVSGVKSVVGKGREKYQEGVEKGDELLGKLSQYFKEKSDEISEKMAEKREKSTDKKVEELQTQIQKEREEGKGKITAEAPSGFWQDVVEDKQQTDARIIDLLALIADSVSKPGMVRKILKGTKKGIVATGGFLKKAGALGGKGLAGVGRAGWGATAGLAGPAARMAGQGIAGTTRLAGQGIAGTARLGGQAISGGLGLAGRGLGATGEFIAEDWRKTKEHMASIFGKKKKEQKTKKKFFDVYRKDEIEPGNPLLSAKQQQEREALFEDGKPIKRTSDIDRPVLEAETGETLISGDDLRTGLVDQYGKPIYKEEKKGIFGQVAKGVFQRGEKLLGEGFSDIKGITQFLAKTGVGAVSGIWNKLMSTKTKEDDPLLIAVREIKTFMEKKFSRVDEAIRMYIEGEKEEDIRVGSAKWLRKQGEDEEDKSGLIIPPKTTKKYARKKQDKSEEDENGLMEDAAGVSIGNAATKLIGKLKGMAGSAGAVLTGGMGLTSMLGSSMSGIAAAGTGAMVGSGLLIALAAAGGAVLGSVIRNIKIGDKTIGEWTTGGFEKMMNWFSGEDKRSKKIDEQVKETAIRAKQEYLLNLKRAGVPKKTIESWKSIDPSKTNAEALRRRYVNIIKNQTDQEAYELEYTGKSEKQFEAWLKSIEEEKEGALQRRKDMIKNAKILKKHGASVDQLDRYFQMQPGQQSADYFQKVMKNLSTKAETQKERQKILEISGERRKSISIKNIAREAIKKYKPVYDKNTKYVGQNKEIAKSKAMDVAKAWLTAEYPDLDKTTVNRLLRYAELKTLGEDEKAKGGLKGLQKRAKEDLKLDQLTDTEVEKKREKNLKKFISKGVQIYKEYKDAHWNYGDSLKKEDLAEAGAEHAVRTWLSSQDLTEIEKEKLHQIIISKVKGKDIKAMKLREKLEDQTKFSLKGIKKSKEEKATKEKFKSIIEKGYEKFKKKYEEVRSWTESFPWVDNSEENKQTAIEFVMNWVKANYTWLSGQEKKAIKFAILQKHEGKSGKVEKRIELLTQQELEDQGKQKEREVEKAAEETKKKSKEQQKKKQKEIESPSYAHPGAQVEKPKTKGEAKTGAHDTKVKSEPTEGERQVQEEIRKTAEEDKQFKKQQIDTLNVMNQNLVQLLENIGLVAENTDRLKTMSDEVGKAVSENASNNVVAPVTNNVIGEQSTGKPGIDITKRKY